MPNTSKKPTPRELSRLPPQAVEAEQSVLGGLLLDSRKWDEIAETIKADDFYSEVVKKITTVLAFWFFNQASTPEEFNALIEQMEKGEL